MESSEFERYSPQHPLPHEIQKMKRDDTVCQFCGVSYLIHTEIKALEEKLKRTEAELERFKGSVEKAKELETQLAALRAEMNSKLDSFNNAENQINALTSDRKDLQVKLDDATARKKALEANSEAMKKDLEKYRDTSNRLGAALMTRIKPNLTNLCEEHGRLKREVFDLETQMKEEMRILLRNTSLAVGNFFSKSESAAAAAEQKAVEESRRLQKERDDLERAKKEMEGALGQTRSELEKLLETHRGQDTEVLGLRNQLEEQIGKNRSLTLELEQHKEIVGRKAKEQTRWEQSLRERERLGEERLRKTEADLLQCQFDLQEAKRLCQSYLQERDNLSVNANEILQRQSTSESEARALRENLESAQTEMRNLQSERQKMIVAHQSRVEQLKESYKAKIHEAGGWTEKLEAELSQAKAQHTQELAALEARMKENFAMELEIEQQKHTEMLERYKANASYSAESEWRAKFAALEARSDAMVAEMKAAKCAVEEEATAERSSHKREVLNLQTVIEDLRARLNSQPEADPAELLQLRRELASERRGTEQWEEHSAELERKLEAAKEQVIHLQDTVRRECEERFELTEKLSSMKEELLAFRRPPQGFSAPRGPPRTGRSSGPPSSIPEPSSTLSRHGSLGSLQTTPGAPGPPTNVLPVSVNRRSTSGDLRTAAAMAAVTSSGRNGTSVVATKRRLAALMASQRRT